MYQTRLKSRFTFSIYNQLCQHHLLERLCFLIKFLWCLGKQPIGHKSVDLFLGYVLSYWRIFFMSTPYYQWLLQVWSISWNQEVYISPPTSYFLIKIVLTVLCHLYFYVNFRVKFSISKKIFLVENWNLTLIFFNPWTWAYLPIYLYLLWLFSAVFYGY